MCSYSIRKLIPPTVLSVRIAPKCRTTVYMLNIIVGCLFPAFRKIIRLEKPCMNVFPDFSQVQDPQGIITDDHKSTTGYVFLGSGGAITWKSKKQTMITLSTKEAEYVALSEAGCEATWLRNLYSKLGFPQINPTIIKGDNDGSVVLTHNPQFHQ